jgi:two-component system, NtrC family, response regulator HydG
MDVSPAVLRNLKILVIDDEENHARATAEILERVGYNVTIATSGETGIKTLKADRFGIVVTDLNMSPVSGLDILRAAKAQDPKCEVILISGTGNIDAAVSAMKHGAASFLTKPLSLEGLRGQVAELASKLIAPQPPPVSGAPRKAEIVRAVGDVRNSEFPEFIGQSEKLRSIFNTIKRVAPTPATVLITGANGTGKELVARAIHRLSPRALEPFVALNCGAMSESILESELFGHVRGAFTGAVGNREGRFEFADKGTLFLDEVGDMSLSLQVKLLRVIQEREIVRVGANEARPIDVRLIAATNKHLESEVRKGYFREDLFYRLKVVHVHMPELKDRREDIPALVHHFIGTANQTFGRTVQGIEPQALQMLMDYEWPGNVRQLKNAVETMVLLAQGEVLTIADCPAEVRQTQKRAFGLAPLEAFEGLPLAGIEEFMIRHHLTRLGGNRAKAAAALGISERTLYRKLKEYGINE